MELSGDVAGLISGGLSFFGLGCYARDLDGFRIRRVYAICVAGILDQVAPVKAQRKVIQQIRSEDVVVVEAIVPDILRGIVITVGNYFDRYESRRCHEDCDSGQKMVALCR